jgi:hypothetical protein
MADLDNAAPLGDDDDDLLSDLRSAMRGDEPETEAPEPTEVEGPTEAEDTGSRARDERGRFASKVAEAVDGEQPVAEAPVAEEAPQEAAPVTQEGQGEPLAARPPPGWSPAAKVAFDALPAEVKTAVAQREVEINKGFAKLAEYKPIEQYAEMAKRNGTTLDYALQQYTGIEQLLKQDFLSGIDRLCQNSRIDPVSLAQAILARSGSAPQTAAGDQQQGYQTPQSAVPEPVMQKIQQLESYIAHQQQVQAQQAQAEVQSSIQQFAADPSNKFFENVRPQMAQLMQTGTASTLKEAYDAACWMNPEIRNLLIKQQSTGQAQVAKQAAAATQARQATKSITGSPSPGASSAKAAHPDIEDELRAAFRAAKV